MEEKWLAKGKREVSPFQTLSSTGYYAIEKAKASEGGSTLEVLTAMLTASMMVEAVLNHVAADLFVRKSNRPVLWELVERASPEKKLRIIGEEAGFRPDLSRPPFQHMRAMFRFRNLVAHGKTEVVEGQTIYDGSDTASVHRSPEFMPEWERECTMENAEFYHDAAYEIAVELCRVANVDYPMNQGSWSSSPIEPEIPHGAIDT